jgi:splicing factor 3A subunit 3
LIERFTNSTNQLSDVYKDVNGERAREVQALGGPNEFAEFYSRLKVMKEVHRRNPNEEATSLTLEFDKKIAYVSNPDRVEKEMVRFSDEEGYGKFLDMHLLFDQYINLKGIKVSLFHLFNLINLMRIFRKLTTFITWKSLINCMRFLVTRPKRLVPTKSTSTAF